MFIEAVDGQRPNRRNNIPLIRCKMSRKQVEEFRERVLLQEIIHLVETDLACAAILCFGPYRFHHFADVLESAIKANVVILGLNPTATIKQRLDDLQQRLLNSASQHDVVLPREAFAQEGPKLRFLVQQVEGRLREAFVRVKEMVDSPRVRNRSRRLFWKMAQW